MRDYFCKELDYDTFELLPGAVNGLPGMRMRSISVPPARPSKVATTNLSSTAPTFVPAKTRSRSLSPEARTFVPGNGISAGQATTRRPEVARGRSRQRSLSPAASPYIPTYNKYRSYQQQQQPIYDHVPPQVSHQHVQFHPMHMNQHQPNMRSASPMYISAYVPPHRRNSVPSGQSSRSVSYSPDPMSRMVSIPTSQRMVAAPHMAGGYY
jgi:hypothetical protein